MPKGPTSKRSSPAANSASPTTLLHAVEVPGVDDLSREARHGLLRPEPRGLVETNHIFVRIHGLFERPQRHIGVLRGDQREAAAQHPAVAGATNARSGWLSTSALRTAPPAR